MIVCWAIILLYILSFLNE